MSEPGVTSLNSLARHNSKELPELTTFTPQWLLSKDNTNTAAAPQPSNWAAKPEPPRANGRWRPEGGPNVDDRWRPADDDRLRNYQDEERWRGGVDPSLRDKPRADFVAKETWRGDDRQHAPRNSRWVDVSASRAEPGALDADYYGPGSAGEGTSRWRPSPGAPAGALKSPGANQWGTPKREDAPWTPARNERPGAPAQGDKLGAAGGPVAAAAATDKFVPSARGRGLAGSKWVDGSGAGAAPGAPIAAEGRQPFSMGRGRGLGDGQRGFPPAPGSGRPLPSVGELYTGPLRPPLGESLPRPSGLSHPSSDGAVQRYSTQQLLGAGERLAQRCGGAVPLPPRLELAALVEVIPEIVDDERLAPELRPAAAQQQQQQQQVQQQVPVVSPEAFAADQWLYRDPQGVIQGPFGKLDIMEWFEAGFFPPDLPLRSQVDPPSAPFVPLSTLIKGWLHIGAGHAPPGFVPAAQPAAPAVAAPGGMAALHAEVQAEIQAEASAAAQAQQQQQQQQLEEERMRAGLSLGAWLTSQPAAEAPELQPLQHLQPTSAANASPFQQQLDLAQGRWHMEAATAQQQQQQQQQQVPGGYSPLAHQQLQQQQPMMAYTPLLHQPQAQAEQQQQQQQPLGAYNPLGHAAQAAGLMQAAVPTSQAPSLASFLTSAFAPAAAAPAAPWAQLLQQQQPQQQQVPAHLPVEQGQAHPPVGLPTHLPFAQQPTAAPSTSSPQQQVQVQRAVDIAQQNSSPLIQQQQQQQQEEEGGWTVFSNTKQRPVAAANESFEPATPPAAAQPASSQQQAQQQAQQQSAAVVVSLSELALGQDEAAAARAAAAAAPAKLAPWAQARQPDALSSGPSLKQIQMEEAARAAVEAASRPAQLPLADTLARGPSGNGWAAAAPAAAAPAPPRAKSLKQILEEEQQARSKAAAAEQAAAVEPAPAPVQQQARAAAKAAAAAAEALPSAAAAAAAAAKPRAKALLEIQEEERAAKAAAEQQRRQQAAATAASSGASPLLAAAAGPARGGTKIDIAALFRGSPAGANAAAAAAKPSAWGAAARPVAAPLSQIMASAAEETAADLEGGGSYEEDVEELIFHYNARHQQQQQQQQVPAVQAPATRIVTPAKPGWAAMATPKAGVAARQPPVKPAAAAPAPARATAAPVAPDDDGLFWDYRPAATAKGPAAAAAPAVRPAQQQQQQQRQQAAAPAAAAPSIGAEDGPLLLGSLEISSEFRGWCRQQMLAFNGNEDLTLIEFLMQLNSGGEVVDYCQMYLGNRPGMSTFVAEFLKRKAADSEKLRRQKAGKGGNKGGGDGAGAGRSAWVAAAAAGGGAGKKGGAGAGGGKKGKKVDASLLGFATKTDFSLLAGQQD